MVKPEYLQMTLSRRIGVVEINTIYLWHFRYYQLAMKHIKVVSLGWNDFPDSLISSAEMSDDCVSKFAYSWG